MADVVDCPALLHGDRLGVLIARGIAMKRDDDLLRDLLFRMEADEDAYFIHAATDGSSDQELAVAYHLMLLADAGFVQESGRSGGAWRITSAGHDFINVVRDDGLWAKTKAAAGKFKGASLNMIFRIAEGYVRQELIKLGVPL